MLCVLEGRMQSEGEGHTMKNKDREFIKSGNK